VRVLFPAIPADHVSGRGADFVSAYTARYGAPGLYTVYAAEAATAIVDAIARSNGTRAGVLRELRRGPRDGLLGRYAFDAAGDTTLRRYAALVVDQERFRFERVVDVSLRPTG
jgi:ABC-type branched-subunit amino acid transport system substrate-binding protein